MPIVSRAGKGAPLSGTDHDKNLRSGGGFESVSALVADIGTYSFWASGDRVRTAEEGFLYRVAASDATNHHLTTAGGVKLYVLPGPDGMFNARAFGAKGDNATNDYAALDTAIQAAAGVRPIVIPAGIYYVSQTLDIKKGSSRLIGATSGMYGSNLTTLRFPIDTRGIHVHPRGAWRDKRMYEYDTGTSVLADAAPLYFGAALSYAPAHPGIPYAEPGAHLVCEDGTYYLVADAAASDHTHTTRAGIKLHQQAAGVKRPPIGNPSGSSIENLHLQGGGRTNWGVATSHGIKSQNRVLVSGTYISGFGGDGIHIGASTDGTAIPGESYGNANVFRLHRITCYANCRDGLHVQGADANAGTVIESDFMLNGRFGINERSFLGNTFFGCHSDGNGTPGNVPAVPGGNSLSQTSTVTLGGQRYSAHPLASEEQLRTTSPADQNAVLPNMDTTGLPNTMAVWVPTTTGGSSYAREWSAVQPVNTYIHGGNYIAMRPTQRNTFIGCYEESGGTGHFISGHNLMLGGILSGNETMHGSELSARNGNELTVKLVRTNGSSPNASLGGGSGTVVAADGLADGGTYRFKSHNLRDFRWDYNNGDSTVAFRITGASTTEQFGTGTPQPHKLWADQIAIGTRRHTSGPTAPSSGTWARGDIVWNQDPTAGANAGWICTASGSPGTWKQFGAIAS